ncbi:hypothetical protein M378DRAFT_242040 [Amanita muscaria Koide BX008]|uniref:Uncharacterized protein n=1 Tax=Amanita muscaria (strain Koide BX008) TaxID=946122 RepID=A0A0C2XQ37_AMAMK|nr:hypothetical protein M378DRAFT_242040 [Amanita muscaria Koide BX008]
MVVPTKTKPQIPAGPVKLTVGVEESRAQRHQRQLSRFRDRGGIFVPTTRNTLADILLKRRAASPKKSLSRAASPQKSLRRSASPTKRDTRSEDVTDSKRLRLLRKLRGKIVCLVSPRRLPKEMQGRKMLRTIRELRLLRKHRGKIVCLVSPMRPLDKCKVRFRSGFSFHIC